MQVLGTAQRNGGGAIISRRPISRAATGGRLSLFDRTVAEADVEVVGVGKGVERTATVACLLRSISAVEVSGVVMAIDGGGTVHGLGTGWRPARELSCAGCA